MNNIKENYFNPNKFHRSDLIDEPLYVISPIFNSQRYRSRWKLYEDFIEYVCDSGNAHLVTVECSFGERSKVFKEQISEKHTIIHVNTSSEIWIKENLINIGFQFLPDTWKYVSWIDSDITFARQDWVGETIHQLQHYHLIQMFKEALDLDMNNNPYQIHTGFMYSYHEFLMGCKPKSYDDYYCLNQKDRKTEWHPGFAFAATRYAIDKLGGLIDFAILGSADRHMCHSLIGSPIEKHLHKNLTSSYKKHVQIWQQRAEKFIQRNVGYMDGLLLHSFHGRKANRKYGDRWKILIENKFEPEWDLVRNSQGVLVLSENKIKLRDQCRLYFKQRLEDENYLPDSDRKF